MPAASAEARGLLAAVAFLTRIPVRARLEAEDVARGAASFTLVGAGVGAVTGGVAAALRGSLTSPLAAVVALAAGALLTGALHLDALADVADAAGAWTRERALEIMRDHAIGAYGAIALVVDLAAKGVALAVLAERGPVLRYAVCAAAVARAAPVLLSGALPYARPGEGLGRTLAGTSRVRAVVSCGIAAGLCVWLDAVWLLAVAAVVTIVAGIVARRWLGGVTGDVLGAATELTETVALVTAVALT